MDPLIAGGLIAVFGLVLGGAFDSSCPSSTSWLDPRTGDAIHVETVLDRATASEVVLLGEQHDVKAHHRWQLAMLKRLYDRKPQMTIGFEAFPRRVQPVLDQWSQGALSEEAFLQKVDWQKVWGFDPDLYMPLFRFARDRHLPVFALNVEHDFVRRVGKAGWDGVAPFAREGISKPAPAPTAYRDALVGLLSAHYHHHGAKSGAYSALTPEQRQDRFVEAQLTWDRAMAQALASAVSENPEKLVVGIAGQGHLDYGYGIPHQLADLGIDGVMVLRPWHADDDCPEHGPGGVPIADALFVIDAPDGDKAEP